MIRILAVFIFCLHHILELIVYAMDIMKKAKNVLGQELDICGCEPMTGWLRDGSCNTNLDDYGIHTVCCVVTKDFLEFSKQQGNDLSTPRPEFNFSGLKPGDHWCVCAARWLDAHKAGKACPIKLESCHEETLAVIPLNILKQFNIDTLIP